MFVGPMMQKHVHRCARTTLAMSERSTGTGLASPTSTTTFAGVSLMIVPLRTVLSVLNTWSSGRYFLARAMISASVSVAKSSPRAASFFPSLMIKFGSTSRRRSSHVGPNFAAEIKLRAIAPVADHRPLGFHAEAGEALGSEEDRILGRVLPNPSRDVGQGAAIFGLLPIFPHKNAAGEKRAEHRGDYRESDAQPRLFPRQCPPPAPPLPARRPSRGCRRKRPPPPACEPGGINFDASNGRGNSMRKNAKTAIHKAPADTIACRQERCPATIAAAVAMMTVNGNNCKNEGMASVNRIKMPETISATQAAALRAMGCPEVNRARPSMPANASDGPVGDVDKHQNHQQPRSAKWLQTDEKRNRMNLAEDITNRKQAQHRDSHQDGHATGAMDGIAGR